VNCSQARALLAIFRELKQHDRQALEQHLAHCDACKEASAQALFVGEHIRSATQIEPPADAYDKLMHTLAAEHVRYLQKTPVPSTTTPIPAFLTPYLPELARKAPYAHSLAALSTADTGALPVIKFGTRVRRRGPQMRHFAIVGIAASFLVMLMSTGLLSLLYLANQNQQSTPISRGNAQVIGQAIGQASLAQFNLTPDYPNIASASSNNGIIYYSAYNHDRSSWTLDKFAQQDALHTTTTTSEPLVTTMDAHQIIVLGSSNNWLFWLQMEPNTKTTAKKGQSNPSNAGNTSKSSGTTSRTPTTQANANKLTGSWSLQSLYIGNDTGSNTGSNNSTGNNASSNASNPGVQATPTAKTPSTPAVRTGTTPATKSAGTQTPTTSVQPQALHSDTFNASAAPAWVTSPIQGISFFQDSAIVAYIDSKGASYLTQYSFDASNPAKPAQSTKLASVATGHILTSPTTNDNGHSIYWSEEWYTQQDGLQGEIWHRQLVAAQPDNASGRFSPHLQAQTYLYSTNTNSFRPQIVNNTLFLLSKDPSTKILLPDQGKLTTQASSQGTPQGNATATAPANNAAATPSPTPQQNTTQTQLPGDQLSIDPTIRTPQIDENITGKLQAFVLNSITPANTIIDDNKIVVGIHGGTNYLIWKDPDGRYEMYDARNNVMVNGINDIDRSATFMSVSGNSVLWTQPDTSSTQTQPTDGTNTQVTFDVLSWPR
jgi:hypothetical protein